MSTAEHPSRRPTAIHAKSDLLNDRKFRGFALLTVLFNGCLLGLLAFRPTGHSTLLIVDNCAQFVGPLLALPLCFPRPTSWRPWRQHRLSRQDLVAILLGLGILCFAAGQIVWSYYELVLGQTTPFPSLADVFFMSEYPLLMFGILFLPSSRLSSKIRWRVSIDSFMILAAIVTFSWYFVLGPTILQGGESVLARVVGTAYPAWDLALVACLFVLFAHRRRGISGETIALLTTGLLLMVVADTLFDFTTLHGTYQTGALLDVGWPAACMLLGLGAYHIRNEGMHTAEGGDDQADSETQPEKRWTHYLPYASVPGLAALLFYVNHNAGAPELRSGVEIGSALLVALVLGRQILAIEENRALWQRLSRKNKELENANSRLQSLATTDPLTNLPNHRAMVAALDLELERAYRFHRPCSVLFADVDHFKDLNDSMGHASGDAALAWFAAMMRESLRGIDVAGRWGGEEFVAVLPESDTSGAVKVAERMRKSVAGMPIVLPNGTARMTCSIGVASYPTDGETRSAPIDAADRAMYAAKRLGRNQVRRAGESSLGLLTLEVGRESVLQHEAILRMVEALAALVEARDLQTGKHAEHVGQLAMSLARELGCGISEANLIGLAAKLHDIGKIGVPDAVLQKPGRLTADDWQLVRQHPVVGAEIVGRIPELSEVAPILRGHHERWDGQGYPDALSGYQISLGARILAVADAFSAMTNDRPYREGVSEAEAMAELVRSSGSQFDPQVVAAMVRTLEASSGLSEDQGVG